MNTILITFAFLGLTIFSLVVFLIMSEFVRAVRQGTRVATVVSRRILRERRPRFKVVLRCVRDELTTSYSSLRIGGIEIPRDLDEPVRRQRH